MRRRPLADRLRIPVYDAVDPAITSGIREQVDSSLGRQGEILDLLAGRFGPYPFSTVGAIVDPKRPVLFALETRPARSTRRPSGSTSAAAIRSTPTTSSFTSLPPVVRGQRRARSLAGHLAQRATDEFIALAESVSGRQLDDLFNAWLFTPERPERPTATQRERAGRMSPAASESARAWLEATSDRLRQGRY